MKPNCRHFKPLTKHFIIVYPRLHSGCSTISRKYFRIKGTSCVWYVSWLSFVGTIENKSVAALSNLKACVLEVWDWIYDVDYTNWDPFMWTSYSRRGATSSLRGLVGTARKIYSQRRCMPRHFIKLIYSTGDAARSRPWYASTQTPRDLDLCSTSVWHIHHPSLAGPVIKLSTSIWQDMHHGVVYTWRLLGDAGGVTPQGDVYNLFSVSISSEFMSGFTHKNVLSSTNNCSKQERIWMCLESKNLLPPLGFLALSSQNPPVVRLAVFSHQLFMNLDS